MRGQPLFGAHGAFVELHGCHQMPGLTDVTFSEEDFECLASEDRELTEDLTQLVDRLSELLFSMSSLFDPDRVVFGGDL